MFRRIILRRTIPRKQFSTNVQKLETRQEVEGIKYMM